MVPSDSSAKVEDESGRGIAAGGWKEAVYMTVHPEPVVPRWTVQPEPVVPRMAVHPEPVVPRWAVQPEPVVPRMTSQPEPVVPRAEEEFSLLLEGIVEFFVESVSRVDYRYVCLDKDISL
jgi:hypothetical protein